MHEGGRDVVWPKGGVEGRGPIGRPDQGHDPGCEAWAAGHQVEDITSIDRQQGLIGDQVGTSERQLGDDQRYDAEQAPESEGPEDGQAFPTSESAPLAQEERAQQDRGGEGGCVREPERQAQQDTQRERVASAATIEQSAPGQHGGQHQRQDLEMTSERDDAALPEEGRSEHQAEASDGSSSRPLGSAHDAVAEHQDGQPERQGHQPPDGEAGAEEGEQGQDEQRLGGAASAEGSVLEPGELEGVAGSQQGRDGGAVELLVGDTPTGNEEQQHELDEVKRDESEQHPVAQAPGNEGLETVPEHRHHGSRAAGVTPTGSPSIVGDVLIGVGLFLLARVALILSAPDLLTMVDQATWKHADLAQDLLRGSLPPVSDLGSLAWNDFNFHQAAFVPYCLGFALFAQVFGAGFFGLHLYAALFGAVGAGAWTALLARHGSRWTGLVFAVALALAPLPAAMLQVRPYSGHTEAQALAALAVALLFGAATPRRWLASGFVAGASVALSPLAAPLLLAGGIGYLLVGPRPVIPSARALGAGALGGLLGGFPYVLRSLLAPKSLFEIPVVEYDQATPPSILSGEAGPSLLEAVREPFHLVVHMDSISAAHAYGGLPAGDSPEANMVLAGATVWCLLVALYRRGSFAGALSLALALGPWITLCFVGMLGPDLALRYLTGIYPMALAALAWTVGTLLLAVWSRGAALGLVSTVAVVVVAAGLLAPWVGPGAQDLSRVVDPSRWGPAVRYNPGIWLSRAGLRALPPVPLWDDALEFLEHRRATGGDRDFDGFDLLFRPENDLSTQGWQPYPPVTAARVAEIVGSEAVPVGLEAPEADQRLRNLGWALAIVGDWQPASVSSLLEDTEGRNGRSSVLEGVGEGLAVTGRVRVRWSNLFGRGSDGVALERGWARGRAGLTEAK